MNESTKDLYQKYRSLFEIIRALENLIERAVILFPDADMRVSLSELKRSLASSSGSDSRKTETGDDGTNDLLVSEVIRTNELQVWFLAEHLVDVPAASTSLLTTSALGFL